MQWGGAVTSWRTDRFSGPWTKDRRNVEDDREAIKNRAETLKIDAYYKYGNYSQNTRRIDTAVKNMLSALDKK